jgi:fermentation-respiration switch protein FrsA (DUF1100 family)
MGRVHRRTVILGLAGTTALGGCSAGPPAPARGAATVPSPAVITSAPLTGTAPDRRFTVGVRKLSLRRGADRPLPTTVWFPKDAGRCPLILFSHGLTVSPAAYAELLTTWARAGFVVAAPAYPHTAAGVPEFNPLDVLNQPADASYVITQVLARLSASVRADRVGAAGHSGGGVTTLGLFTGDRDERIRAGVVLAGRQLLAVPFAGAAAPLLFVHGKRDTTVAYADGRAAYDAAPWPKAFLTVTAGGHVTSGAALDVVAATSTEFWRWSLYGDPSAKARIPRDAKRGGLATLADHL